MTMRGLRGAGVRFATAGRRLGLVTGLALAVGACSFQSVLESGADILQIGGRGNSPGRFNFPRAVLAAPDGRILVIDKTGRIQWFSAEGRCRAVWNVPEAQYGTPTGATFDHNGDLLVADTHYSRILRFSADGTTHTQFGRYGKRRGELVFPTDVAVNSQGDIYVTNYVNELDEQAHTRIMKFRNDGTFVDEWGETGGGEGQFRRPMSLAILDDDGIVVADSCNHRIQRFDRNGRFITLWGGAGRRKGQLNYPYDVAVGPKGRIYVCEYGNHRISVFTRKGRFVKWIGGGGNGPGRFRGPWGCAFDRAGALYVADTYNHRVQRFAPGAI